MNKPSFCLKGAAWASFLAAALAVFSNSAWTAPATVQPQEAAASWPLYEDFLNKNCVSGRIIDFSDPRHITTTEGQSYAMFFALCARDKATFYALWNFTKEHMFPENQALPAWLYGFNDQGKTEILDENNAADADLFFAYNLIEGARLFDDPALLTEAQRLLNAIKADVRFLDTLGHVILPGRAGFESGELLTLNPSYYPPFILKRLGTFDPDFKILYSDLIRTILRLSPNGVVPDWARVDRRGNYLPTAEDESAYNAVRVYLFSGLLNPEDPHYLRLNEHFAPLINFVSMQLCLPDAVNVTSLRAESFGPMYLSAAFMPYMPYAKVTALTRTYLKKRGMQSDGYYGNVLSLFALGFDEKRYAFAPDGSLILEGGSASSAEASQGGR